MTRLAPPLPDRDPEYAYLDLLAQIMAQGHKRIDRTGVGTLSLFGAMMRFNLADGQVPLITTKRVLWKTAIREMIWFLSGETNIRPLLENRVRIWTDWPLAAYRRATGTDISQEDFEARILEDAEFARRWGDLGPVYGKQWRRWLGPDGREHDQIGSIIEALRKNPASRRMLFHAWNPAELDQMALPPCHLVYQFRTTDDGRLDCIMYQRSADMFLGVPFNWISATALQFMLAQQAGLTPGDFVWMGGDVHIYLNHLDQVKEQLSRAPRGLPFLTLGDRPTSIDHYTIDHFSISNYEPWPAIAAPVAV